MKYNKYLRQLLAAFSDAAPAFRPAIHIADGRPNRRLIVAFSDTSPAFNWPESKHPQDIASTSRKSPSSSERAAPYRPSQPDSRQSHSSFQLTPVLAAAAVVTIIVTTIFYLTYGTRPTEYARPAANVADLPTISPNLAEKLRLHAPQTPIGSCTSLAGTGSIPEGKKLLIFDRPVSVDRQRLGPEQYYFDGAAVQDGALWRSPLIKFDTHVGGRVEILAALIDAKVADDLISDAKEDRSLSLLPGDGSVLPPLFLTIASRNGTC